MKHLEDALQKIDRHKTESSLHLAFMVDANFMDNLCVYKMHDPPPILQLQDLAPCKDNNCSARDWDGKDYLRIIPRVVLVEDPRLT